MAATVNIEKAYFETLLRRAQEYSALREALFRGGIAQETLEILIHGDSLDAVSDNNNPADGDDVPPGFHESPFLARQSGNGYSGQAALWPSKEQESTLAKAKSGFYERQYSFGRDDHSHPSELDIINDPGRGPPKIERQQYARAEQRTIVAQNLSDRTTHKDLLTVVRGGAVLDIFLRTNDRSASISFVEGKDAQAFMAHVKRTDIYIYGKRVEWAWNDRQFILPGHVANKISIGATRNLVIRNVHSNITEERIREDLDHIHNLVITDLLHQSGDIVISLNSVHNAMFARTCMMSRLMYKGMRIEWFADECALPLPKQPAAPRKDSAIKPVQKPIAGANRFQMLNMDVIEESSDDDSRNTVDETILPTFSAMKTSRSPWNPIAA